LSLQYVVYDYWDYDYAEGDATLEFGSASVTAVATVSADGLRIRTASGSVTGNATVAAQATTILNGSASVSANAILSAQGTRVQFVSGSIDANATVSAQGIRIRGVSGAISGLASVSAYPNATWAGNASIQAVTVCSVTGQIIGEEWSDVVPQTDTWTEQSASSNIWTPINPGSNFWRNSRFFDPYVDIDYWEDGYTDDRYDYWIKTTTVNDIWTRQ
jgi:hypothetical protein